MTQISVRLPDEVVSYIDAAVAEGRSPSRAAYLLKSLTETQRRERAERDVAIALAARNDPDPDMESFTQWLGTRPYPDLD